MVTSDGDSLVNLEQLDGSPPAEGTIQVKYVNDCGPYGYRVTYIGNDRHRWDYLGKAEDGVEIGSYPPGTPMKFKKRTGWEFVGDWSGRRISPEEEEVE